MAARDSKSKKRSAASCGSTQREIVFFTDKCLGRKIVPSAIQSAGYAVELLTDHFDQDAEDKDWLPVVGKRGWIVLTKDRHIRSNQVEIVALLQAGTAAFVLTSAEGTGQEMATAFVSAIPDMLKLLEKFDRPFVATITLSGKVSMLLTYADLIKQVK